MDYRALLVKYMRHVNAEENMTYVGSRHPVTLLLKDGFTQEEWDELNKIEEEVLEYRKCNGRN